MAIIERRSYVQLVEGDPDDYRPNSSIALVLDPPRADGKYVSGLMVLFERIAPGDRIPLHVHAAEDEALFIDAGTAEVLLGEERRTVHAGTVVFVPSGTPHQLRNTGPDPLLLHAVYPARTISI